MKEADDIKLYGGYMFTKGRKALLFLFAGAMILGCVACGNSQTGNTENSQMETESEKVIEIADANDILTKVWDTYEDVDSDGNMYNDKFAVMGGHFASAVMDKPAKYDLTKTSDLALMYCVPETAISMIDDAATVVHLMKASTFTAGAYHVKDVANVQTIADGIKTQTLENQWLGGFPDELLIVKVDEQYVVSVYGTTEVVENFKEALSAVYGKQVSILVEEAIR